MLAQSPRASCSPRYARFSAPPRSPRSPRAAHAARPAPDRRENPSGSSGLKIRTGARKTGVGRKTRAQQLAEWKLRRAAAALEDSSANASHARGMSSKRRRSDAAAVVAAKNAKQMPSRRKTSTLRCQQSSIGRLSQVSNPWERKHQLALVRP